MQSANSNHQPAVPHGLKASSVSLHLLSIPSHRVSAVVAL